MTPSNPAIQQSSNQTIKQSNRVFISAGEASGDAYGAALIRQMRHLAEPSDTLQFEGVGGARMRKEGARLYADSSKWGAISITQAVRVGFRILGKLQGVKKYLRQGPSGLFVPIDFGFANIRIARYAKKYGWKVLYFVPPGSWRRNSQGKDLPEVTDAVVTPFEWSAEILNKMGAKAYWFGHPIKQLIEEAGPLPSAERTSIAVLPGSRHHELEMNLPLIADAVQGKIGDWKSANVPGVSYERLSAPEKPIPDTLEFALAPTVDLEAFKATWHRLAPGRNDVFAVNDTYGVLQRAKIGIICSGTATLEAAICRCPMVVVYQISPAMRREAKMLMNVFRQKAPKFIALPNIIVDRLIVPELAKRDGVRPAELREWLDRLLDDPEICERQQREFEELDLLLGPSDAISKTATLAISLISAKPS